MSIRPGRSGSVTNGTTGSTVDYDLTSANGGQAAFATVALDVTGTWTATLSFYYSIDGTHFYALTGNPVGGGAAVGSVAANGRWLFDVAGFATFRVKATAYTSGTAAVVAQAGISRVAVNLTLDSSGLPIDADGNVMVAEQNAPVAEDNTNGVIAGLMKPVAASGYAPSSYVNFGAATKANVKNAAGNVYAVYVTNVNAAVRYFQLHNKATAPAATEVPQQVWTVPAGTATAPGTLILDSSYFAPSERFSTGIGFALSTTEGTFTDSATAGEHTCRVRYV